MLGRQQGATLGRSRAHAWLLSSLLPSGCAQYGGAGIGGLSSSLAPVARGPLIVGGLELSREDDIENLEKISASFNQIFYTKIMVPDDEQVQEAWRGLSND